MKDKNEEEILDAEDRFRAYLNLCKRIAVRLEEEEKVGIVHLPLSSPDAEVDNDVEVEWVDGQAICRSKKEEEKLRRKGEK